MGQTGLKWKNENRIPVVILLLGVFSGCAAVQDTGTESAVSAEPAESPKTNIPSAGNWNESVGFGWHRVNLLYDGIPHIKTGLMDQALRPSQAPVSTSSGGRPMLH